MGLKEELALVIAVSLSLALVTSLAVGFGVFSGIASVPFASLAMLVAFVAFAVVFAFTGVVIWALFRLSHRNGRGGRNRGR